MRRTFLLLLFICAVAVDANTDELFECRLNCVHGGYCSLVSDDVSALKAAYQSGRMIETCVCPSGYTGMACEIEEATCSEETLTCPNGMPCSRTGDGRYTCACSEHEAVSSFAAQMCHRTFTEYCSLRFDPTKQMPFCTNGGKCKNGIFAAQVSPLNLTAMDALQYEGCFCPPEFYGPHCEFLRIDAMDDQEPSATSNGVLSTQKSAFDGSNSSGSKHHAPALPIILICFFGCFIIIAVVAYRRYSRRKRQLRAFASASVSESCSTAPPVPNRGLLDDVSEFTDDPYLEHSEYSYKEGYSTQSEFDAVEDDFSILDPLRPPIETQSQEYFLW